MQNIQELINKSYPPTHTFEIHSLNPTKWLSDRYGIITRNFPHFFVGDRLLDVACNKGWFSLYHAEVFKKIDAFDIDGPMLEVARALNKWDHITFINASFRNFTTNHQYDRIFLANGPHHMFREINGHEWIAKLAAMSNYGGYVLMEGSPNNKIRDLEEYPDSYNEIIPQMNRWFTLEQKVPTTSYTPGRFFFLWKRKGSERYEGEIYEKKFRHDKYLDNNAVDMFAASTEPYSNGIIRLTEEGWIEKKIPNCQPYHYFENEHTLFNAHCRQQIYLSKLGYWDIDSATINFTRGSNVYFDKSGVMPISKMEQKHIDVYFILLNQSYRTVPEQVKQTIRKGLEHRRPAVFENSYRKAIQIWPK